MAFNNYLEDENDKPYFTTNSLAYYYDKMEGFAKAVEGSAKALNLTKEEVEKRLTLYIEQNKNELDQRLAQWDGKLETFDSSVETLLTEWVDDGTLTHVIDSTLIDQRIAPVTAQLAEKVGGQVKLKPEELSDEAMALVTGNGTVNVLSIPQDNSVTIPKIPLTTVDFLNDKAFHKVAGLDSELKNKHNLLGKVDVAFFNALSKSQATTSLSENNLIEMKGKKSNVVDVTLLKTVNPANKFIAIERPVSTNKVYYFGAWYKKSDLKAIADSSQRFLSPFISLIDGAGANVGSIGTTNVEQGLLNFEAVGDQYVNSGSNGELKTEILEVVGDWAFLETSYKVINPNAVKILFYFVRFVSITELSTLKIIAPTLTEFKRNPFVNYYGDSAEFEDDKLEVKLSTQKQQILNEVGVIGGPSKWTGKLWRVFGDSNSNRSHDVYHTLIARELNITVGNHAIGGAGYRFKASVDGKDRVYEQMEKAPGDGDLITFMAGGNDFASSVPLGVMGDTTISTFYGALDITLNTVINKYPLSTIACFIQMRRTNEVPTTGPTVKQMADATKQVCEKYGIPYLDLYHQSGFLPYKESWQAIHMPDGVHLSLEGQKLLADKVKSFINTL